MMVDVFRVRIVKIGEKGKEEAPSPTLSIPPVSHNPLVTKIVSKTANFVLRLIDRYIIILIDIFGVPHNSLPKLREKNNFLLTLQ